MDEDPDQQLARRIRVFINSTPYTQASLATAAGISVKSVYNAMKATVSEETRHVLSDTLDELEDANPPGGYDALQRIAALEDRVADLTERLNVLADHLEAGG